MNEQKFEYVIKKIYYVVQVEEIDQYGFSNRNILFKSNQFPTLEAANEYMESISTKHSRGGSFYERKWNDAPHGFHEIYIQKCSEDIKTYWE